MNSKAKAAILFNKMFKDDIPTLEKSYQVTYLNLIRIIRVPCSDSIFVGHKMKQIHYFYYQTKFYLKIIVKKLITVRIG